MNSAVAEAAAARVDDLLPEQLDLVDLVGAEVPVTRRGGRPLGARNKRLADVARIVRETLGDVLLHQAAIATMPLADLIALGLKPKEALEEKRLSAGTILPYIEQRQPVQVDVTGRQVVYLTIAEGVVEGVLDQGVTEAVVLQSDSAQSDAPANPLTLRAPRPAEQLMADQPAATPPPPPAAPPEGVPPPRGAGFAPAPLRRAPVGVVPARLGIYPPRNNLGPGMGAAGA